jgi:hypothetical protein
MKPWDVIVVGSGASAVHAAWPLVEDGREVLMLDVGHEDAAYRQIIPELPFAELRRTDAQQHRYFLGERFEGIPLGLLGSGPQLTPPRHYVLKQEVDAPCLAPVIASQFDAIESLALGGLAGAWGAGCFSFLDSELRRAGLDPAQIRPHYEKVARRIGVSAGDDDLGPLFGTLEARMPGLELDSNAERIYERYRRQRDSFISRGTYVGRTPLAVLSQPLGERRPQSYGDMDFWSNCGGCVYRAALSVRELRKRPNFCYHRPYLVERFQEKAGQVVACARSLIDNSAETFSARRLILAAGALGTTRIVLRSLEKYDEAVPLTCNPHSYVPSIHLPAIGMPQKQRRHSLAQLTLVFDATGTREHLVQAQAFSYRSLMLFRLLNQSSLALREALLMMRALAPYLVIWLINHEDAQSESRVCRLRRDQAGNDRLEISYSRSTPEEAIQSFEEAKIRDAIRMLGCLPLKTVRSRHGASIHYGSQLPMSDEDKPLTTERSGRLRGTEAVFIADGAALAYLPAKGLTFTLMANADRIGGCVGATL